MKNKKLLFVGAGFIAFAIITVVVLVLVLSNSTALSNESPLSAIDYAHAFVAEGLPVDNIIEYDEETDVNDLLGRPGQYISKVNFADMRCEQFDVEDPVGGTVEVFATSTDMQSRKNYLEALQGEVSILVNAYFYVSADGLGLLRVSFDLTPSEAQEYADIFENENIRDYIAESNNESSATSLSSASEAQTTSPIDASGITVVDDESEIASEATSTPSEAATIRPATEQTSDAPPQNAPNRTQEAIATPTPASSDSSQTASQKNALKSAKQYLSFTAFSYEGLIEQLEYEKYSHEDAVYAVDNCGANWNEQALKSAKQYLGHTAFSHSGLISQLEYEKFTSEQASYGADNCGADWNEQAAKSAKQYLEYSSFSRDSLIDQLEYEGFTHDQAVYGVEANGL